MAIFKTERVVENRPRDPISSKEYIIDPYVSKETRESSSLLKKRTREEARKPSESISESGQKRSKRRSEVRRNKYDEMRETIEKQTTMQTRLSVEDALEEELN